MNPYFLPNETEEKLIEIIHSYSRSEFALIRITKTMIDKSIIDASDSIRLILKDSSLVSFDDIDQGEKVFRSVLIFSQTDIIEQKVSFYRPNTKKGDPRFWVYDLKKYVNVSDLVYFTIFDNKLICIPLVQGTDFDNSLKKLFGNTQNTEELLESVSKQLSTIKDTWIISTSPEKRNDKDVGETLELALGINPNSLVSADIAGEIELKAKRKQSKTKDSLFSRVPDWEISPIGSSKNMILKYGYMDANSRHPDFLQLFVTVSNKPNKQKLYMDDDPENLHILQIHLDDEIICRWRYETLKKRLYEKHPSTLWVLADEEKKDGKIHFQYNQVQFTQRPIFTQFVLLVRQGVITFDWRGRVKPDGSKIRDHGHGFRMNPKDRHRLFGQIRNIEL